jgi:NADH dehydrogenase [ubiquinone] 1 alpha subcomplex assembly factor 7
VDHGRGALLVCAEAPDRGVTPLGQRIASAIALDGPLSISQFMTMALFDPLAGYYATHDPLSEQRDFLTAPETSQMFGELLGLWCVDCWFNQVRPSPARFVELGPGTGALMSDALRAAKLAPDFAKSVDVTLVEASPVLRAKQQERLRDARVAWTSQFDAKLTDRPLFLIANEFFDCLPIRQFVKTAKGWCENMVVADAAGNLSRALSPDPVPIDVPEARGPAKNGAVFETSPASTALVEQIAETIAARGGAALIVDYGYTGAGFGETLQAIGGHQFQDVLATPGEVDLSAHVDFDALADAAERAGAAVYGPRPQGVFLEKLGIRNRADKLIAQNPGEREKIERALTRLTDSEQMGLLFKVLAILPKGADAPTGFKKRF